MTGFPQRLRALRESREMSQSELGQVLSCSKQTISNYENGVSAPDFATLSSLASYFSVSVDYLLGRTDNPAGDLLSVNEILDMIVKVDNVPQDVVDEALRRIAAAKGAIDTRRADAVKVDPDLNRSNGTNEPLPAWAAKLPPDLREFLEDESRRDWVYLRLARGVELKDLTEEQMRAIMETWLDAKKSHAEEKEK